MNISENKMSECGVCDDKLVLNFNFGWKELSVFCPICGVDR